MGIFSFLKGKDTEATEVAEVTERQATPTAAVRTTSGVVSEPPNRETTPEVFTPPEAWNTEALTAPRPEVAAEKPAGG